MLDPAMSVMDHQLPTTVTLQLPARDRDGLLPSTPLGPDEALPVSHLPAMIRVSNDMPYLIHLFPHQIHPHNHKYPEQRGSQPRIQVPDRAQL
jgi:hypothetical protein